MDRTLTMPVVGITLSEERANQLTHGVGFALSLAGAFSFLWTVTFHASSPQWLGSLIYCISLVALYASSTLSHSFEDAERRTFYRMLDQVCIFLVIPGSFTPFALMHLEGLFRWSILVLMWTLAIVGSVIRIVQREKTLALWLYIPLGWLPALAFAEIAAVGGTLGLAIVILSSLCFMIGFWFLINDHRHSYYHAIWHILVICGSACHFWYLFMTVALWKP